MFIRYFGYIIRLYLKDFCFKFLICQASTQYSDECKDVVDIDPCAEADYRIRKMAVSKCSIIKVGSLRMDQDGFNSDCYAQVKLISV